MGNGSQPGPYYLIFKCTSPWKGYTLEGPWPWLAAISKASVKYTDKPADILPALKNLDLLYLSNNQPMKDAYLRKGIFDFASSGKGLLLVHPALWYNWNDWPEYNRVLVGGGAKSHDKFGEFEVTVTDPNHPIMAGVPRTFNITDELYHFESDPNGSPMIVLATGKNITTGKTYPVREVPRRTTRRLSQPRFLLLVPSHT